MSVDQQFNSINDKLQLLLKQYSRLQKENERLRDEVQESKSRELELNQQLEEMGQQLTILKLGSSGLNEKDKKEFEKKINQYVREIDKCISFLSQ